RDHSNGRTVGSLPPGGRRAVSFARPTGCGWRWLPPPRRYRHAPGGEAPISGSLERTDGWKPSSRRKASSFFCTPDRVRLAVVAASSTISPCSGWRGADIGITRTDGRLEAFLPAEGEQFLLHARQGAAGGGCRLLDDIAMLRVERRRYRDHSNGRTVGSLPPGGRRAVSFARPTGCGWRWLPPPRRYRHAPGGEAP